MEVSLDILITDVLQKNLWVAAELHRLYVDYYVTM